MPLPSKFPIWAATGRQAAWGYIAWKSYEEWTDGDAGLDDVWMGAGFAVSTVALIIPAPLATATGFIIRQGIVPSITRAATSVVAFSMNTARALAGLPAFATGGVAGRLVWAAGITHIATLPWQIKDIQEKKEREGQVDTMALVPLEPGQNPMPIYSLGGPGMMIW